MGGRQGRAQGQGHRRGGCTARGPGAPASPRSQQTRSAGCWTTAPATCGPSGTRSSIWGTLSETCVAPSLLPVPAAPCAPPWQCTRLTRALPPAQVTSPAELAAAPRLVFPGVGAFGAAMRVLTDRGYVQPLRDYVQVRATSLPPRHGACSSTVAVAHTVVSRSPSPRRVAARSWASASACRSCLTAATSPAASRAWASSQGLCGASTLPPACRCLTSAGRGWPMKSHHVVKLQGGQYHDKVS